MDANYLRNLKMKYQVAQKQKAQQAKQAQQSIGARQLSNMMAQPLANQVKAGNVGALNRVIWPFWFTFSAPELAPQTSSQGFFTVTQEAAFVLMAITKAVYSKTTGPTQYTYIDPNDESASGQADGLKWTLRDAQSSRVFSNLPVEMDQFGSPEWPFILSTPIMFLPNSTVEMTYQNDNAASTFVPYMTFFGYRVRVEDAQNLLGTVVG